MTTPRRAGLRERTTRWMSPRVRGSVRRSVCRQPQRRAGRAQAALSGAGEPSLAGLGHRGLALQLIPAALVSRFAAKPEKLTWT